MGNVLIGCLAVAVLSIGRRWMTANAEVNALRGEIASLKRQLKRHRAA